MKEKAPDIIEDISLVAPPEPFAWLWPTVAAVVLLVIAGWFIFRLYRKKKLPFQEQVIPPHLSAKDALAASRKLLDQGLHREFVTEVSRVLRVYIEDRFGLRAPHLSTEEFLFQAERSDRLTPEWQEALGDFLFRCDRVKFALDRLELPRMEELYATAERFIDQTAEVPAA